MMKKITILSVLIFTYLSVFGGFFPQMALATGSEKERSIPSSIGRALWTVPAPMSGISMDGIAWASIY